MQGSPPCPGAQRRDPTPVQAPGDVCDAGTSTDLSGTLQSLISCFPNGLGEEVCPCALYNTCEASNHSTEAREVRHHSPRCRGISWVLPYPGLWLSPPCHNPPGSGTTRSPASPLLRGGATRSSLPHLSLATPTVLQPFHRRGTSQHGASVWDTGTYAAALLHPSSCALHQRYPQETGGETGLCSTAAVSPSQETASINRRHIHPLLTWGWPFPGWARAQATLLVSRQSQEGGQREAGMRCGRERAGETDRSFRTEVRPEVLWISPGCSGSGQRHGG